MRLLNRFERKLGHFALPQLTLVIIVTQVLAYVLTQLPLGQPLAIEGEQVVGRLMLIPQLVLQGEVWRLVTFLVVPPMTNILFAFFFWYIFYLMGTALESHWGDFRYNLYLLVGYIATVAVSFLTPGAAASNAFLEGSVFLAFAYLFPNFELHLFFVLPVKIKWLAMIAWIGCFLAVVFEDWPIRLMVLASVCNFLVFFGREIIERMRYGRRQMARQAARIGVKDAGYFHRCTTCGITDRTHPTMDFRYCDQCAGSCGYCTAHIQNHEHVKSMDTVGQSGENMSG
jgi:hypothetical protein